MANVNKPLLERPLTSEIAVQDETLEQFNNQILDRFFLELDKVGKSDRAICAELGKNPSMLTDLRRKRPDTRISTLTSFIRAYKLDIVQIFGGFPAPDQGNNRPDDLTTIDHFILEWRRSDRMLSNFDAELQDYCILYGYAEQEDALQPIFVGSKSLPAKIMSGLTLDTLQHIISDTDNGTKKTILQSNQNITPDNFSFTMQRTRLNRPGGKVDIYDYDRLALPVTLENGEDAILVFSRLIDTH